MDFRTEICSFSNQVSWTVERIVISPLFHTIVKLGISLKEKKLILGAREDKVLRRN
jgi:hypothetical protein